MGNRGCLSSELEGDQEGTATRCSSLSLLTAFPVVTLFKAGDRYLGPAASYAARDCFELLRLRLGARPERRVIPDFSSEN
jgi:hypothetical protein